MVHKIRSIKKPIEIMLFLLTNFSEHRIVSIRSCKTRINTGVNGFRGEVEWDIIDSALRKSQALNP